MRTLVIGLLLATSTFAAADDKKPEAKPEEKKVEKADKPNCHALDDAGASITDVVGAKSATDCATKLLLAVKEAKCNDAAMTGKTVNYQQVFDTGLTAGKPIKQKATCLKKDVKK